MVGERLSELRKDRSMSKEFLAEQLSLSVHTISSYEQDKSDPDDEIKVKIAKIFNVSLDYLLGLINEQLALDREYDYTLPPHLPVEAKKEADTFLDYLKFKYNKNKK